MENDDLFWFLDRWLITRSDGDTVLNGTPGQFEADLRDHIHNENRKLLRGIHRELDKVKERVTDER